MNKLQQRIISITLVFTLIFSGVPAQAFGDVVDEVASPSEEQVAPEVPESDPVVEESDAEGANPQAEDDEDSLSAQDPDGEEDSDEVEPSDSAEFQERIVWNIGANKMPDPNDVKDWMEFRFSIDGETFDLSSDYDRLGLPQKPSINIETYDGYWILSCSVPTQITKGSESKKVEWNAWSPTDEIMTASKVGDYLVSQRDCASSDSDDGKITVFTHVSEYSATIKWVGDTVEKRPSKDILKNGAIIYRFANSGNPEKANGHIILSESAGDEWTLSLNDLPAYGEDDGAEYVYSVEFNADFGSYRYEAVYPDEGSSLGNGQVLTLTYDSIAKESEEKTFEVAWNDNRNIAKSRPDSEGFLESWALLQYKLDGKWKTLEESDLAALGMTEMPTLSVEGDDESQNWAVKTTPVTTKIKGDDGKEKEVNWRIIANDSTVSGTDYLAAFDEEKNELKFTVKVEYSATVQWLDNKDAYKTRPNSTNPREFYAVYRYLASEGVKDAVKLDIVPNVKPNGDKWELTLKDQPAYDENGESYVYFIQPENTPMPVGNEGDAYVLTVDNPSNFNQDKEHLYSGAEAEELLTGKVNVAYNKIWDDPKVKNRPDYQVYSWRVVETAPNSKEAVSDISKPFPVQDSEYIPVPSKKENGELIESGEKTKFTYIEQAEKYNSAGARYIYFAEEAMKAANGHGGEYKTTIDNSQSDYSDGVESAFDDKGYVLSGGTLTNEREVKGKISSKKTFAATSMQDDTAKVKMALQKRVEGGRWEYATENDILDKGENTEIENGKVIITIEGFKAEEPTITKEGPEVYTVLKTAEKEEDLGKNVEYRWIEVSFAIANGEDVQVEYVQVKAIDEFAEAIEYEKVNAGEYAPGVEGELTTAFCQPEQDGNYHVVNTLEGEHEFVFKKTWHDENGNITEKVTDPVDFTVSYFDDEAGKTQTETITLNAGRSPEGDFYPDEKGGHREKSKTYNRYDKRGKEIEYKVNEPNPGEGYIPTVETKNQVVDKDGIKFLQTVVEIDNGIGTSLEFDVQKKWLDESDELTRRPVKVQVYYRGNGRDVSVSEEEILSTSNNWYKKIGFKPYVDSNTGEKDMDITHYYVREIAVGGRDTNKDLGDSKKYPSFTDGEKFVGVIEPGDNKEYLDFTYNVYAEYSKKSGEGNEAKANCTITNQRIGEINIEMSKTWVAGGATPVGHFEIYRYKFAETDKAEKCAEFDLDGKSDGIALSGGITASNSVSKNGDRVTQTITISGLDKYAADFDLSNEYASDGSRWYYRVAETSIGGIKIEDGGATVEGDQYISQVFEGEKTIHGADKHHSGDIYRWSATNTRSDSVPLNAYKVWRDDGSEKTVKERPDVCFTVKRIAVPESIYTSAGFDSYNYIKEYEGDPETVGSTYYWDTKINTWCWRCEVGTLPRYDRDGRHYVYYYEENVNAGSGEYQKGYVNDTSIKLTENKSAQDTKEVLPNPSSSDLDTSFCMLADGKEHIEKADNNSYPRITVNYRVGTRDITVQKDWILPTDWNVELSAMPTIYVDVYKSLKKDVLSTASYTEEDILNKVAAGEVTKANDVSLELPDDKGAFSGTLTGLDKYDGYGRPYYYYLSEEPTSDYDPTPKGSGYDWSQDYLKEYPPAQINITPGAFAISNNFIPTDPRVQVTVRKNWESKVPGVEIKDLATTEFVLYAQLTDGNEKLIGNKFKMASGTLDPSESDGTLTFSTFNFKGQQTALPYYGPNDKPLQYFVEEQSVPNGYGWEVVGSNPKISGESGQVIPVDVTLDGDDEAGYSSTTEYKNTYTGGYTELDVEKEWKNDSAEDNSMGKDLAAEYECASVAFTIKQKLKDAEPAANDKMIRGEDNPVVVNSDSDWNATIMSDVANNKLPKYDEQGRELSYYVDKEILRDGAGKEITFNEPKENPYEQIKNALGYTNKLKVRNIEVKKNWTSSTGDAMDEDQLKKLVDLGYIPSEAIFSLEQKIGEGDWTAVTDNSGNQLSTTVKAKDTNYYTNINVVWKGMPEYTPQGESISYHVKEKIGDVEWISDEAGESDVMPFDTSSSFVGEKASAETTNTSGKQAVTFKNELQLKKYKLEKIWDDNNNQDNQRPESITIQVQRLGASGDPEASTEFALDKSMLIKDGADEGNAWITDMLLPEIADGAQIENLFNAIDDLEESGYEYDGTGWNLETQTKTLWVKNKLEPNRKTVSLTATKNYKDSDWKSITRPVKISFKLFYQEKGSSRWAYIEESSSVDEGGVKTDSYLGDAEQTLNFADGSNAAEAKWTGLLKYWTEGKNDGTGCADPVKYKVVETMYGQNDTVLNISETAYAANPAEERDFPQNSTLYPTPDSTTNTDISTSIRNEVQVKPVSVKKIWNGFNGNALTEAELNKLIKEGAVPQKLTFKLQYRAEGETQWTSLDKQYEYGTVAVWKDAQTEYVPAYNGKGEKLEWRFVEYKDGQIVSGKTNATIEYGSVDNAAIDPLNPQQQVVTNNLIAGSLTVSKTWDDDNDRDGVRPNIKFELYRDGAVYDTQTCNAVDWTYTWTNLPVYKNNPGEAGSVPSEYYVKEIDAASSKGCTLAEYKAEIKIDSEQPINIESSKNASSNNLSLTKNGARTIAFTNKHDPELITVYGEKEWSDDDDRDGVRPEGIKVQLNADGSKVAEKTVNADADGNWSFSFQSDNSVKLYKYKNHGQVIKYSLHEDSVDKYTSKIEGTTAEGFTFAFKVTNTHEIEKVSIPVEKIWNNHDGDDGNPLNASDEMPEGIIVRLYADGNDAGKTVTLDPGNTWKASFDSLPKYKDSGTKIVYTTQEEGVGANYDQQKTNNFNSQTSTGTEQFTNELKTANLTVSKNWADEDDQDGKRPASIKVVLKRNGAQYGDQIVLNEGNEWTYTWNNLPIYNKGSDVKSNYSIDEVDADDAVDAGEQPDKPLSNYTKSIVVKRGNETLSSDPFFNLDWEQKTVTTVATITNSYTPETITVDATKDWADDDNRDGKRPSKIEISVIADGDVDNPVDTGEIAPKDDGTWPTWTSKDLPKYKDHGTRIAYTVVEKKIGDDGYSAMYAYSTDDPNDVKITNKHDIEKTSVSVNKIWNDRNDKYKKRAKIIQVRLYADGVRTDKVKSLTEENNWHADFTDLPKNKKGKVGEAIVYTVKEEDLDEVHYKLRDVTGAMDTGYFIANDLKTGDIEFKKTHSVNETCSSDPNKTESFDKATFGLYFKDDKTMDVPLQTASPVNGVVIFSGIAVGDYAIKEISTDKDHEVDETTYYASVVFNKSVGLEDADGKSIPSNVVNNEHKRVDLSLAKVSEGDSAMFLPGAKFQLDRVATEDGKDTLQKVAEATTGEDGKLAFNGLLTDVQYRITETAAPEGSYLTDLTIDVKYVVDEETGKASLVTNHPEYFADDQIEWADPDVVVSIEKVDEDDKPLAGAGLQIKNDRGKVIDEWVSEDEPHVITRVTEDGFKLVPGETYTLVETSSPDGYAIADPVEFSIPSDTVVLEKKPVISVKMVDKLVPPIMNINKVDENGRPVPGATLKVVDSNGADVTVTLDTDEQVVEFDSATKPVVIKNGLVPGQTYRLVEVAAPEGYELSKPVEFVAPGYDKSADVTMTDNTLAIASIQKVDENSRPVEGAVLKVVNADGKTIAKWTSTKDPYLLTGQKLVPGTALKLIEVRAPEGYEKAEPVEFDMPDYGKTASVVMVDKHSPDKPGKKGKGGGLSKTGDDLNPLAAVGAAFAAALAALGAVGARRFRRRAEEM